MSWKEQVFLIFCPLNVHLWNSFIQTYIPTMNDSTDNYPAFAWRNVNTQQKMMKKKSIWIGTFMFMGLIWLWDVWPLHCMTQDSENEVWTFQLLLFIFPSHVHWVTWPSDSEVWLESPHRPIGNYVTLYHGFLGVHFSLIVQTFHSDSNRPSACLLISRYILQKLVKTHESLSK